jgi:RHS repeat-associated protein
LKIDYDYGTATQNNGSLREQKINYVGLANEIKQSYGYDNLNRLQSSTETVNNVDTWKQTFQYDRFGNRRIDYGNTTIGVSNKITNPLINTNDNRLKKDQDNDNITDYDYDKTGNLTLDAENKRFIYDAENHVKSFFKGTNNSNTPDATYLYDGEGNRVKKISSTEITVFVYDSVNKLVAEYSTKTSDQPKVSYLTADHLGSPRIITDNLGKVISRHDYLAFGDEVTDTVGNVGGRNSTQGYGVEDDIRKQYTGYEKDEESGLDFAQARYYNGKHGRFTSVDPLVASANVKDPQTFNRYSYVMNSPYKFTDPLGLIAEGGKPSLTSKIANYLDGGRKGSELSDDDIALVEFHIANGSAQYHAASNLLESSYREVPNGQSDYRWSYPGKTVTTTVDADCNCADAGRTISTTTTTEVTLPAADPISNKYYALFYVLYLQLGASVIDRYNNGGDTVYVEKSTPTITIGPDGKPQSATTGQTNLGVSNNRMTVNEQITLLEVEFRRELNANVPVPDNVPGATLKFQTDTIVNTIKGDARTGAYGEVWNTEAGRNASKNIPYEHKIMVFFGGPKFFPNK